MNNNTHHHAALYHCSLAITAVAMAFTLNSCQDEEFGFTKEEIAATAAARHYKEAFQEEFAKIDPEHTWMCTPDTIVGAQLKAVTRGAAGVPTVTQVQDTVLTVDYLEVKAALKFVEEKQDNRGICGQDFEYIATEDKYVFDIHPTFWGRKFCNHNAVGVWYINEADERVDLPSFWEDWNNKIYAVCEHGERQNVQNSTSPITDKPGEGVYDEIPMTLHQHWNGYQHVTCPVDHYEFPSYKIEVPVGMKWGLYLETKQNQSSNSNTIRWYSNAQYNPNGASAAASFEFGGINYVSFEDAPNPYNCTHGDTGTCSYCQTYNGQHFGHYDHDMNDIVLAITPHPIESTYKAIKYRVMCEDLGGTFDWDFNDLVLDVLYEEGTQQGAKATTKVEVKAVGGTLPIALLYNNEVKVPELHTWFGQSPDDEGLYEPINVIGSHTAVTSQTAFTIQHDWSIMAGGYDVREIVKNISVRVNTYTDVEFPNSKGGDIPQCFMCPINVDWSTELVNISDTYPDFPSWVASQGETDWWKSGFNTGTQEIKQ